MQYLPVRKVQVRKVYVRREPVRKVNILSRLWNATEVPAPQYASASTYSLIAVATFAFAILVIAATVALALIPFYLPSKAVAPAKTAGM